MDEEIFERIKLFLPPYLSSDAKRRLFEDLTRFPENPAIYWDASEEPGVLQGDGQRGAVVLDWSTGRLIEPACLVISNTCDIAAENDPPEHARIVVTPLLRLDRYSEDLLKSGWTKEQVDSHLDAVRQQMKTSVFYLPGHADVPEAIALLDDLHSFPLRRFDSRRQRIFRLNQYGFYIFLLKLSIHLCRSQEGVQRN